MKRLIDNIARYILTVSGFTTSVVILLIIGFLYRRRRICLGAQQGKRCKKAERTANQEHLR